MNQSIEEEEKKVAERKAEISNCEAMIVKYEEYQDNVRNNREYEAIVREIEAQKLDIELNNKYNKESQTLINAQSEYIDECNLKIKDATQELENKQQDLHDIMESTKQEEAELLEAREKQVSVLDNRLYVSYARIRKLSRNGLAVVPVERSACGGCFSALPPQKLVEIKEKNKILVCEHCGRIFSHVIEPKEDQAKPKRKRRTSKTSKATKTAKTAKGTKVATKVAKTSSD